MATHPLWRDEYWLLLMQIYLQKPVGVKPVYSRDVVDLGLELHIPPQVLASKMQQIASLDTPRIERIWQTYSSSPHKLTRAVSLLRSMKGFGRADEFYDGVEVNETWEKDWQPIDGEQRLTPVMLILVLDLYFRLTPATMVKETPEVQELAKRIGLAAADVAVSLQAFQYCDPYLKRRSIPTGALQEACQAVWQRYGNGETEALVALAAQLAEYYR
mgnify:CR=1 FL=1